MRRVLPFLLLALLPACAYKNRQIADAPLPFASANYTVLGATSADSCGTYIFAIDFGHLFSNQRASVTSVSAFPASIFGLLGGPNAEESRAMYDALDKMPEATNLYAPRFEDKVDGFAPFGLPIFAKRCATITAHGVQLGTGPVPNAQ